MTTIPYDAISTSSQKDTVFTKCCCCIPLRIGCFILGYLNLVITSIHTLSLLTITTYIGITTNWFDHVDTDRVEVTTEIGDGIESIEKPILTHVEILLVVLLFANVAWLCINVACVVGLHKRRPGPIKVFIAFAVARLVLIFFGVVYLIPGNTSVETIVSYTLDLGVAAYFILVYYLYALQLEREQKKGDTTVINPSPVYAYPTKLDKQVLVA